MRRSPALLALLPLAAAVAQADSSVRNATAFAAGHVDIGDHRYAYRLLEPLPQQRATAQPLVVFLHGAGERGTDNVAQCRWLPDWLAEPAQRTAFPCYVLALQCPADEQWVDVPWSGERNLRAPARPTRALAAVVQAIDALLARPGIDRARVYVTGLSMGGFGAFDLAAREPDRFAALLAVCGGGDPAAVPRLAGLPTQVWHGAADPVVPPQRSRELAAAFAAIGRPIGYHELAGVGHDVWRQAYTSDALAWLFAQDHRQQRRGAFARPAMVPRADAEQLAGGWFQLQSGARCFAPAAAQPAAALFLSALRVAAILRPGLTEAGEPAPGDVVFRIDAGQADAFVVDVGAQYVVTARDERCLRAAAAAAVQLLGTGPGGSCPRGRFTRRQLAGGSVVLPPGFAVTTADRVAALRTCWWVGADELELPAADGGDPAAEAELAKEAARFGVALVQPGQRRVRADERVFAGLPVDEVLRSSGGGNAPRPFVLVVPGSAAGSSGVALPWSAAAAAERAAHGDPIHIGEFWSRLGHLQR